MNLAKRIRDLRYSKGWGPDELANRAKISRTALYQIERGNTSKPQAGTLRRISRALGVPLEILLDSTPVLSEQIPSSEGPAEGGSYSHAVISGSLERSLSSDRADELIEKFRMLLGSPLADGIARIVEESFRLLPIIPPPVAQAEPSRSYVPSLDIDMPRRGRGRPRITTSE
ncbi:MAG: helix-turn-helix transcriptional regulator [Isosphaeraceae bacterium]